MTESCNSPLAPAELRHAFSQFATGICVASLTLGDGRRAGITVNSFTSVSLEPALALFCIGNSSQLFDAFRPGTAMAFSVLSAAQESVSRAFARSATQCSTPEMLSHTVGDVPAVPDALAVLAGEVTARVPAGDHDIVVVQISSLEVNDEAPGLAYFRGAYAHLGGDA